MLGFLVGIALLVNQQVIIEEICSYNWNCETATQIAFNESRFTQEAVNYDCAPTIRIGIICAGIFQIYIGHYKGYWQDLLDYRINISEAFKLYTKEGFVPWGH